jgi:DNA end-binding protein Ku
VRVVDGVLVLNTMLYDDEVIDSADLDIPDASDVEVTERELKMARQLVDSLTVDDFEPEKFTDEYRQRVMELIEAKAAGEVVVAASPEAEPTKVVDLLAALEASVAAAKAAKAEKADADAG